MWAPWWVWLAAALVLVILEVFAPGCVFLGFALGAAVTGLTLLAGGPMAAWLSGSLPLLLLFFAVVSVVAWLVMRKIFGFKDSQVKTFDHDINED